MPYQRRTGRDAAGSFAHRDARPYAGDELSVDHIIPFAVMPQLDHVIANLEMMPLRMNRSKGD